MLDNPKPSITDAVDQPSLITNSTVDASDKILIDNPNFLFSADFEREFNDLVLTGQDGKVIIVQDYFLSAEPADLVTPEGGELKGDVVHALAGPDIAGQYAQSGEVEGAVPIGQVETLTGAANVQRTDGTIEPLGVGTKVFQNDVLISEDGSTLSITFIDGTIFTLSENSRMVLSELVYAPDSNENSAVFNLVEGTFVFIAGQAAKTGEMEIKTPVATMGIRGTTVQIEIVTSNGSTIVNVSLNRDPDGTAGSFTITGLNGEVIANVDAVESKWLIAPDGNSATEVERTEAEIAADLTLITEAYNAYEDSRQRVDDGGEFVEPSDVDPNEPGEDPDANETEELEGEDGSLGDQGNLQGQGSGLETDFAEEESGSGFQDEIEELDDRLPVAANDEPDPQTEAPEQVVDEEAENDEVAVEVNIANVLRLPDQAINVVEDAQIVLSGFVEAGAPGVTYSVTLDAGSTIEIVEGSGVIINHAASIESPQDSGQYDFLVISGTSEQIAAALNGAIYRPSPNDDDGGTLTIVITDGVGTATSTLVVGITPVNDAPIAVADSATTNEDTAKTINVLGNDIDVDGDQLSFTTTNGEADISANNGVVSVNAANNIVYVPKANFSGTDTITYSVTDGNGLVDTGTVTVTVRPVNDDPVAVDDTATTDEDTAVAIDVLANDTDIDGNTLFVATNQNGAPIASANNGTVALNANGQIVYTPNANFVGNDNITYTVTDNNGGTDQGLVTVTVNPGIDEPVNTIAGPQNFNEDVQATITGISVADGDDNGDQYTVNLSVNNGLLNVVTGIANGVPAVNITNNGSDNVTLTGTLAQLNTQCGQINYS
ncbi:MAG: Ig-like domain-containing protein [Pseudomonadota bacterium]